MKSVVVAALTVAKSRVYAVKARAFAFLCTLLILGATSVVPAHATGNFSGSANTIPDLSSTLTTAQNSGGAAIETYGPALVGTLFLFLVFRFAWNRIKGAVH